MELKTYLIPLRRWWWLIVAATALAALSGYLATRNRPDLYSTTATVMIGGSAENPVPTGGDTWMAEEIANTYADIVQRKPIRDATMAALGLEFMPGYTTRQVPETRLLEINVVDTDPARAQAVANELVNQLALLSAKGLGQDDTQQQFLTDELSDLQTAIRQTRAEIAAKEEQLAGMFSARQIADTQSQIGGLQNKLYSLQDNYASLLSNSRQGAANKVTVIEEAELPDAPIGAGRSSTILLAAAIGFLLAAGAAYVMEYLDDTLKNPDDVRKVMDLVTLGAVPRMKVVNGAEPMPMLAEGQSVAAEAFRVLRTNLQFTAVDHALRTLVITSPAPTEGKSLTAMNLAAAMAQAGNRIVLVDADLHRPRVHRALGMRNNVGLTTALLSGDADLDGLLQPSTVPGLNVLTTGPLPPNPAELLGSSRMRGLVEALCAQADIVLFDSPPVMALADTAILGSQVDAVLMVVSAGETRREMARRAMVVLQQVRARVVGAVLNRMPTESSGYYYYYHYGYHDRASGHGGNGGASPRRGRRRRMKDEGGGMKDEASVS